MKVGDVIRLKSFEHCWPWGDREMYKASEGRRRKKGEPTKVFVAIFLGLDELEEPNLDPDEVLQRLGWTPPAKDGEEGSDG